MNTNSTKAQVVCGVLPNARGKLLIAQRGPTQKQAGWWEFPGGKVQPIETPAQALVREWQEELQLTVTVVAFLGQQPLGLSPDGPQELAAYQLQLVGPFKPVLVEHAQWAWCHFKDLKELKLLPADVALLPDIEGHLRG